MNNYSIQITGDAAKILDLFNKSGIGSPESILKYSLALYVKAIQEIKKNKKIGVINEDDGIESIIIIPQGEI